MADPNAKQYDIETDHEYDGIKEFDNPLPAWWLGTFFIAIIFSAVYWVGFRSIPSEGSFDEFDLKWADYQVGVAASQASAESLAVLAVDADAVARGAKIFTTNCVSCHLAQGQGVVGPNLTDAYWINGAKSTDIWNVIYNGGREGKGMIAWSGSLGAKKVNDVTAFIMAKIQDTNVEGLPAQGVDAAGNAP